MRTPAPPNPRIRRPAGSPVLWAYTAGGGRRGPGGAGDVYDLAGGRTLSRGAGVTFGRGPGQQALAFAGAAGVPLPALGLSGARPFSVVAWLSCTTPATIQEWFSVGTDAATNNCELVKDYPSAGNLAVLAGGSVPFFVAYPTPEAAWHRVAFTSTGAAAAFYADGALLGSTAVALPIADVNWTVGYSGPQSNYPWRGGIADVQLFDYALSAADVARDWADPAWRLRAPAPAPPVAAAAAAFNWSDPAVAGPRVAVVGTWAGLLR